MKRLLQLALLLASGAATAGTLTYNWTNPTQFEDNTPLAAADITQTRIERGTCTATDTFGTKIVDIINTGNGTTRTETGVAAGKYCIRAYTTAKGVESESSATRVATVLQSPPKPPVLVAVGVAAMIPVYNPEYGWAMGERVGNVKLGSECDATIAYGKGWYALKNPKTDVRYYVGQKPQAVVAARCANAA